VVISLGKDNWWGLPHTPVLELYRAFGCEIYRTDLHGAVTINSDGKNLMVETCRSLEGG